MIRRSFFLSLFLTSLISVGTVDAQALRIVSYNTANDVGSAGTDTHFPTIGGPATRVFQAMAALNINGGGRPIDVLALQESQYYTGSGINPTAQGFVNVLNAIYGTGQYAAATLNGTTTGANIGNGPQTLVYRTSTVQILSQVALGTPSGAGVARQVMQYQLKPVDGGANSAFYLFNNHFKSGATTEDDNRRGIEAGIIVSAVNAMPNNTPIIFAGDYNAFNNTADQGYRGVTTLPTNNKAIDPLNPNNVTQNWDSAAFKSMSTLSPATTAGFTGQSTVGMRYRDDFIMNSGGMVNGSDIHYVNNSFTIFGNTGTHTYAGALTTGDSSVFASQLLGYSPSAASNVLADLALLSDHLPVIAQYAYTPVPEPGTILIVSCVFVWWVIRRAMK